MIFKDDLEKALKRLELNKRQTESLSFGTFDECRSIIVEVFCNVDSSITKTNLKWLPQYNKVAKWMSDTKGKGLVLTGRCGTGKSLILNYVLPICFLTKMRKVVKPVHAKECLDVDFMKDLLSRKIIAIDDVGSEAQMVRYGQRYDVIHDLMLSIEDKNKTLLITSNLTGKELEDRYDERAMDRLVKMCEIVKFDNKESLR